MSEPIFLSVFESYNARALSPQQVAKTFVAPDTFTELVKRRNTIIVGPRGTGKTTLLKMLQIPALENWENEMASDIAKSIDYSTVFIPTDKYWASQLDALGEGKLDEETHKIFAISAYTTIILRAIVKTFIYRTNDPNLSLREIKKVDLSPEEEKDVVSQLSDVWRLDPYTPTFISLKQSLSRRLLSIKEEARQEGWLGEDGRKARIADSDYLNLPFIEAAVNGVEIFDDAIGEYEGRWTLAFDELELAPSFILNELLSALRSSYDKLIFKLALSPSRRKFESLEHPFAPSQDDDFDLIRLWYIHKNEFKEFCEKLWYSFLEDRSMPKYDPYKVFGESPFDPQDNKYSTSSEWGRLFRKLYNNDSTFRNYLKSKEIDPSNLDNLEGKIKTGIIRKIAPILPLRNYYAKFDEKNGKTVITKRSRNKHLLYSGAKTVFEVTEGNPRWLIGIFDRLINYINDNKVSISPEKQSQEIRKASSRFISLIQTLPSPKTNLKITSKGVSGLLSTIGNYFFREHVMKEFKQEPYLTFEVDSMSDLSEEIYEMLDIAYHIGAIIYVGDSDEDILSGLEGNRFRISYSLASEYKLPIRLGKSVSLKNILKDEIGDSVTSNQLELYQTKVEQNENPRA